MFVATNNCSHHLAVNTIPNENPPAGRDQGLLPSVCMLVVFCLFFAPFLCAWCVLGFCVCLCVVLSPSLPLEATGGRGRWSSGQHTCSSSTIINTPIYIQSNLPVPVGSLNQSQWENASRTWTCSCVFETSAYLFSVSPQTTTPEPETLPTCQHCRPEPWAWVWAWVTPPLSSFLENMPC